MQSKGDSSGESCPIKRGYQLNLYSLDFRRMRGDLIEEQVLQEVWQEMFSLLGAISNKMMQLQSKKLIIKTKYKQFLGNQWVTF